MKITRKQLSRLIIESMNSENLHEIFFKKKSVKMRVEGSYFILTHPDFEAFDNQYYTRGVESLTSTLAVLHALGYNQIILEDENRTIPTSDLMRQYQGIPPRPKEKISNVDYPILDPDDIDDDKKYK